MMRIKEITWRRHNDFGFIAMCAACGFEEAHDDGYADEQFCLGVVPAQHCPKCGLHARGEAAPAEQPAEVVSP